MRDTEAYEAELERAKMLSLGQTLAKASRLFNERALVLLRSDPRYAATRMRHLAIFPHLDLDGTRITTLAQRMEMTKQGVGQLVTELEAAGLVERVPDPSDGRAKLVQFTEFGRSAIFDGLGALQTLEAQLTESMGPTKRTRLRRDLLMLIEALQQDDPESPQA